jgi:flagellar hook-length control protein FliK
LGAIEVEVLKDVQGVRVTFFAEQSSTGKLLETQLTQLRQSLVDSGVQLSSVNIGQHSHAGQEGGFQHQNTNFAHTSHREEYQNELHVQERPHTERGTRQTSEVDYLI